MDLDNRDKVAKFLKKYFTEICSDNLNVRKNGCEDQKIYNLIYDANSFSGIFFTLSGLDLIKENGVFDEYKDHFTDWLYGYQIHPTNENSAKEGKFGFGIKMENYECCNLAITYCILACLLILGDDLSRVNRSAIIEGLKFYQKEDGRIIQCIYEEESDIRQVYCLVAICYILQIWPIDKEKLASYIISCQSYDNGFGGYRLSEAHGGFTYCAITSLYLMDKLDLLKDKQKTNIAEWCLKLQNSGFQGRPEKDPDSCYSFWIGATLTLLNSYHFIDDKQNRIFLESTHDRLYGGFGKTPLAGADIVHTYLALGAYSLRNYNGFDDPMMEPIHPALNISVRAYNHLKLIQNKWK